MPNNTIDVRELDSTTIPTYKFDDSKNTLYVENGTVYFDPEIDTPVEICDADGDILNLIKALQIIYGTTNYLG